MTNTFPKRANLPLMKSNFLSTNSRLSSDGNLFGKQAASSLSDISTVGDLSDVHSHFGAAMNKTYYENTYKVYPDRKLSVGEVEGIIAEVLNEHLRDQLYDLVKSRQICESISQEIKDKVKALGASRYKLVVLAHIGENRKQGIEITSRCVWNENLDNFASAHFKNTSLFAQAVVFATYYE